MKKGLLFGALALGLAPFELTKKENGDFTYRSVLISVEKKKTDDGDCDLEISFFNRPTAPKYNVCKKCADCEDETFFEGECEDCEDCEDCETCDDCDSSDE